MKGTDVRSEPEGRALVAPVWHTAVLLAVFTAFTLLGWLAQHRAASLPPRHVALAPLQVQAILFEWLTALWVWFGVRRRGIRLRDLVGGRWHDPGSILLDVLLAGGLWLLWTGVSWAETLWLGLDRAAGAIPFPANALETLLAIGVAVSAGICEEVVFRGYLQRQFRALSGSARFAVLLQALIFGLAHVYQGSRLAARVVVYGLLFGLLAIWRRSLRPGILAHCWSDIAARLLRI